ncbi:MAG: signal peptidase [Nocardioidaceae bacterium]|nr:signal peptidase [Actinomycetota bacterium]MDX6371983.1 signal peptidase [Nocardioidaceae bacterium]
MTELASPAQQVPEQQPARRGTPRGWRVLFAVLVVLLVTRAFVAEPLRVSSTSMRPTLMSGDHVLVDKVGPRSHHPQRNDIIAFTIPGTGQLLIKRVAGVAGDVVGIEDGVLVVNRKPVHEPYVNAAEMDSVYFGPVVVPPGRVFVLGDNRANSIDSRRFGPVALSAVTGRVLGRIWPPP